MTKGRRLSNVAEQVVACLRNEILTGQLAGGSPVREHELAARLQVSRTPVREAVGRLVAEGLLTKDGNRTAHVFRPSVAELLEIYEMRVPLESLAARLACEVADAAFLRGLDEAAAVLGAASPGIDWSVKHEAFHTFIAQGSGRRRLGALVSTLRAQSEPYVRFAVTSHAGFSRQAQHDHFAIVELIRQGDGKSVERLVRKHLMATSRRVASLLSEPSKLSSSGYAMPAMPSTGRLTDAENVPSVR